MVRRWRESGGAPVPSVRKTRPSEATSMRSGSDWRFVLTEVYASAAGGTECAQDNLWCRQVARVVRGGDLPKLSMGPLWAKSIAARAAAADQPHIVQATPAADAGCRPEVLSPAGRGPPKGRGVRARLERSSPSALSGCPMAWQALSCLRQGPGSPRPSFAEISTSGERGHRECRVETGEAGVVVGRRVTCQLLDPV